VSYIENFERVPEVMEADAIVADAEAELRGLDTLKALDIAFANGEDACQRV
jgi:hypothetical protein